MDSFDRRFKMQEFHCSLDQISQNFRSEKINVSLDIFKVILKRSPVWSAKNYTAHIKNHRLFSIANIAEFLILFYTILSMSIRSKHIRTMIHLEPNR